MIVKKGKFVKNRRMAEELVKIEGSKKEVYEGVLAQIIALVGNEKDRIANLANVSAVLKETFNFLWVGFYLVKEDELVLGPFQGPVACTRIRKGTGVCGKSWEQKETIIVDNVDDFPGHIACSSLSKSEIVIPLISQGKVIAVLDIDSEKSASFDSTDELYLNELCAWLVNIV